jgi:hypothetical protein
MSDITLTSGIRQNLLSLQQTSADLTTTQEALATGKAVNSAADNPSAYFTSQNLTNSANSLSACSTRSDKARRRSTRPPTASPASPACSSRRCRRCSRRSRQPGRRRFDDRNGRRQPPPGAPTIASRHSTIDVGSSTYNVSIAASSRAAIEADINGTTGLGSRGAVSASDNGAR